MMEKVKQRRLREAAPLLTGGTVYFECGDGWFDILLNLLEELEEIAEHMPERERPYIVQIKEKFGGLRVYVDCTTVEMDEIIREAERKSRSICEECGKPGRQCSPSGYWVFTLCSDCQEKRTPK